MKQISHERFVAALQRLGCVVVTETVFDVTLCRAATLILRVRKLSPIPVVKQRQMIATLDFSEADYLAALPPEK